MDELFLKRKHDVMAGYRLFFEDRLNCHVPSAGCGCQVDWEWYWPCAEDLPRTVYVVGMRPCHYHRHHAQSLDRCRLIVDFYESLLRDRLQFVRDMREGGRIRLPGWPFTFVGMWPRIFRFECWDSYFRNRTRFA